MFDTFSDLGIEGCWCRAELTEGLKFCWKIPWR